MVITEEKRQTIKKEIMEKFDGVLVIEILEILETLINEVKTGVKRNDELQLATNDSKPCIWKLKNDDEYLYYETGCGEELVAGDLPFEECDINYCKSCGNKVRLA